MQIFALINNYTTKTSLTTTERSIYMQNTIQDDFKSTVKKRMARLNVTQQEIATRLNISYPYISDILITRRDTPRVAYLKERIVEILDEIESGCKPGEK